MFFLRSSNAQYFTLLYCSANPISLLRSREWSGHHDIGHTREVPLPCLPGYVCSVHCVGGIRSPIMRMEKFCGISLEEMLLLEKKKLKEFEILHFLNYSWCHLKKCDIWFNVCRIDFLLLPHDVVNYRKYRGFGWWIGLEIGLKDCSNPSCAESTRN